MGRFTASSLHKIGKHIFNINVAGVSAVSNLLGRETAVEMSGCLRSCFSFLYSQRINYIYMIKLFKIYINYIYIYIIKSLGMGTLQSTNLDHVKRQLLCYSNSPVVQELQ